MVPPRLLVFFVLSSCCMRCNTEDIRGPRARSADGGTTLTVSDVTPGCLITVDGKPWKYPVGVAGPVKPGLHTVTCSNTGETIDVETPAHFDTTLDYWGP